MKYTIFLIVNLLICREKGYTQVPENLSAFEATFDTIETEMDRIVKYKNSIEKMSQKEIFDFLDTSKGMLEARQIAQEIGDKYIAGKLKITEDEKLIIRKKVQGHLDGLRTETSETFSEAYNQLLRFGELAIPTMLQNIENPDLRIRGFVLNLLVDMRTERIIKVLIAKTKTTIKDYDKKWLIEILKMMKNYCHTETVPNRPCMNEKSSNEIYERLIKPALKELSQSTENSSKN